MLKCVKQDTTKMRNKLTLYCCTVAGQFDWWPSGNLHLHVWSEHWLWFDAVVRRMGQLPWTPWQHKESRHHLFRRHRSGGSASWCSQTETQVCSLYCFFKDLLNVDYWHIWHSRSGRTANKLFDQQKVFDLTQLHSSRSETDSVADSHPSTNQALRRLARTGENGHIHLTYWTDGVEGEQR